MHENDEIEEHGEKNVPLAWGSVGQNPPPPPPPPPAQRPSVQPPENPVPWAQAAAAENPLRNPTPPPVLGQAIGATTPPPPPAVAVPRPQDTAITQPNGLAGTAPSGAPVLSAEYGVTPPPEAPEVLDSGGSKLPWIAALIGALVLLGSGGFFALTAFSSSGGAETPEAAIDSLIEAINNEDFVTVGELIEPSERRTIVEPLITEFLPELQRLEVLSNEADASSVEGVDFEFTDLTYRVEPIADNPDMVHVYLTGGDFASEFNSAEFPFSDAYREFLGDDLQDEERTVEPIEPSETPLAFVERDGRWYFSGWFTIGESVRVDLDERLPLASEAPAALGSESPEAAVEAMIEEVVELDLAGMIGRMDPEETAALYRYAPLFLDDGQNGLDEFRQFLNEENVAWDIRDLGFDVESSGDEAIVEVRAFTFDITAPDFDLTMTYSRDALSASIVASEGQGTLEATTTNWTIQGVVDGESFNVDITIDPEAGVVRGSGNVAGESGEGQFDFDPTGECSSYSVTFGEETEEGCLEDDLAGDEADVLSNFDTALEQWPTEFPGIAMTTHRTDGEWYISPIGTTFDGILSVMEQLDDGDFEQFTNAADSADPFAGMNDVGNVIEDVVDASSGTEFDDIELTEDSIFSDSDFDDSPFEEIDQSVESNIAFSVERGAVGELEESISRGTYDSATIELEAGDTVVITVETSFESSLDTTLTLLLDGSIVDFNDDASFEADLASSLDSQIDITVSETGTYEIQIGSYEGRGEGEYSLSVARS